MSSTPAARQRLGLARPQLSRGPLARRHARAGLPVAPHAAGGVSHRHTRGERLLPHELREAVRSAAAAEAGRSAESAREERGSAAFALVQAVLR